MTEINLTTWQEERVHGIAVELDRLAYLLDPYEYWDVIGGRDDDHIDAHIAEIEQDLRAGNTVPYIEWLREQIADMDGLGLRDWQRAANRLDHLLTWIAGGPDEE